MLEFAVDQQERPISSYAWGKDATLIEKQDPLSSDWLFHGDVIVHNPMSRMKDP